MYFFTTATNHICDVTTNLKTELKKNKINSIFGNIFLILGIALIYHSWIDFFENNFTSVLFILFRRGNSSIIAEFIFGILLTISGFQILRENKSWLNLVKILAIGVIINIVFYLTLSITSSKIDKVLIIIVITGIFFSYGIYKLTKYLIGINDSEWNIKTERTNLIIGFIIGLFPYLFLNVFYY